jgi:predicted ATP-dependent protease
VAYEAGVKEVILPKNNLKDAQMPPISNTEFDKKFTLVSTIQWALECALLKK